MTSLLVASNGNSRGRGFMERKNRAVERNRGSENVRRKKLNKIKITKKRKCKKTGEATG